MNEKKVVKLEDKVFKILSENLSCFDCSDFNGNELVAAAAEITNHFEEILLDLFANMYNPDQIHDIIQIALQKSPANLVDIKDKPARATL